MALLKIEKFFVAKINKIESNSLVDHFLSKIANKLANKVVQRFSSVAIHPYSEYVFGL